MGYFRTCHLVLLAVVFATVCQAQHYTPEVCLHDASQRMFPVEAARAMAWMENQKADKIAEVTWKVAGEIDGRCEWKIGWKSPQGEEIAGATVTYDLAKLNAGPAYFREVWSQLAKGLHFETGKGMGTAKDLETAFWRGGGRAWGTRMSAVMNAQTWLNQGHPQSNAAEAAELAGLLAQGAAPILGGSCTLDYLMLARAAAWLCHAETLTGTSLTREWCVISHLAGREIPASHAWKEAKDATNQDTSSWRWWDKVLTSYPMTLKDACLFATTPGQAETGLPFLLAFLRFDTGATKVLENMLPELYGRDLVSQADYAPLLTEWFVMGRMRGLCFQAGQKNQREWLELLSLQRQPGADELTSEAADTADAALAAISEEEGKDVAILGLKATGKVVDLGAKAHDGPLRPQAVVSSGELALHGWESSLLVWRGLFEFLDYRMGAHDAAAALVKDVSTAAPSLASMMKKLTLPPGETDFPLTWLEYLEDRKICQVAIYQKGRGTPVQGDPGRAIQFLRNCMKRGPTSSYQWRTLFPSNTGEVNSIRLAEMMLKQSSESVLSYACRFYNLGLPENVRESFQKQGVTMFEKTRKACPNAYLLQRDMLADELKKAAVPALEAAQKLEAHYWLAPGRDHVDFIFEKYVEANALQAARRFYARALQVDGGSIGFSNTEAPMRWMLAWLEGRKNEMNTAARDAATFSARDLEKQSLHALCQGDRTRTSQIAAAYVQRYGPALRATTWLASMLPLLDALKAADNPQHLDAQKQFVKGAEYPDMQFVILRELGISKEDCIKLMELDGSRDGTRLLIAYWKGDAQAFQKARESLAKSRRTQMPAMFKIMVAYLNAQLLQLPEVTSPDLKPEGETQIDVLVRDAIRKTGRPSTSLR